MNVTDDKIRSAIACLHLQRYSEAFTHFKESILISNAQSIDILSLLYKRLSSDFSNNHLRALIAEIHILTSDFKESVAELEELFELDPHYSKTYYLLGKIYNKAGLKLKVLSLFEEAVSLKVFDSAIIDILPKIYIENNNTEKNIQFFKTLITHFPNQFNYYTILSELYVRNRDYESATTILDTLIQKIPSRSAEIIDPLKKLIDQNSRNTIIRYVLVKAYFNIIKPDDAIAELEKIQEINPTEMGEHIPFLKKMLQTFPNHPQTVLLLASLLIEEKEFSESITILRELYTHNKEQAPVIIDNLTRILAEIPNQLMALMLLQDIHVDLNNIELALTFIDQIIEIEPEQAYALKSRLVLISKEHSFFKDMALYQLGKISFHHNELDDVLDICQYLSNTPLKLEGTLLQAELLNHKKKPLEAMSLLKKARKKNPYHWQVHEQIQQTYKLFCQEKLEKTTHGCPLISPMLHLASFDTTTAIEKFQSISVNQETFVDAQILLARSFIEAGRFELALNTLETLLSGKKKGQENTIRYYISVILSLIGKQTHAVHYLDQILSSNVNFEQAISFREILQKNTYLDLRGLGIGGIPATPNKKNHPLSFVIENPENNPTFKKKKTAQTLSFAHSHNNDGVTHFLQGNYKAAEQAFRLALQMDPNLSIAYNNLGYLYLCSNLFDEALSMIDKGLTINKKNDTLLQQKGYLYYMNENYEKALEFFETSHKLNNKNMVTILLMGDVYFAQHRIKSAFDHWKLAQAHPTYSIFVEQRFRYLNEPQLSPSYWMSLSHSF